MMEIIDRIAKFRLTCDVGTRHFHDGHEYVEIGGVKWATMNIGATSPTESGLYFQWGDTQGYTAEEVGSGEEGKKDFELADYKYCNGASYLMTKYNATDAKMVLDAEDDAVTAAWGGNWRMPTIEEFKALHNAVNAVWATDYQGSGVNGLVCTDKTDRSKVLFFPSSGFAYNARINCASGIYGDYWSSSFYNVSMSCARRLHFSSYFVYWNTSGLRHCGFLVRGVVGN